MEDTLKLIQAYVYRGGEIPLSVQAYIFKNLSLIYTWLSSKKFKEKYLDTKHPYPPLFDPDILNEEFESKDLKNVNLEENSNENKNLSLGSNLNENINENSISDLYKKQGLSYKNIPAEIAWDMNLPLPKSLVYKRMLLGSSALVAFPMFMKECDIEECCARDLNSYLKFL
ncbi:hypothetical protein [Campylobacter sp. MIT 99-7217]|uniref:hypothetical protein n=1 Tax=Campylobacter sp. MIT 99-7217 TaxID=535091 RepID=UPI00115A0760|nr:hypothetical protein [Campylobacter sp. MIT 99-7217]